MSVKEGDIVQAVGNGRRLEIILIRHDWAWAQQQAPSTNCPETIRLSTLNDPDYYHVVPTFCVDDLVEHHVQYSYVSVAGVGKVLCIHEDRAWVKFDKHAVPLSPLLTSLKKVA